MSSLFDRVSTKHPARAVVGRFGEKRRKCRRYKGFGLAESMRTARGSQARQRLSEL
jgi:hypothetical protein